MKKFLMTLVLSLLAMNIVFGESVLVINDQELLFSSTVLSTNSDVFVGNRTFPFLGGKDLSFSASGYVSRGILSKDASVKINENTYTFLGGTEIAFHGNGMVRYGYLSSNTVELSIGGSKLSFKNGTLVSFDNEGNLTSGALSGDANITVGDTVYSFKSGTTIIFYGNGKVSKGFLAKSVTNVKVKDNSYSFAANSWISFYVNGTVKDGTLANDVKDVKLGANTFVFKKGTLVSFYANGNVSYGFADNKAISINGNPYVLSKVSFYQSGAIREADLVNNTKDSKVGDNTFSFLGGNLGQISFYEDGGVMGADLASVKSIKIANNSFDLVGGIRFYKDGITFYPSGKIKTAYLAKAAQNIMVGGFYYNFMKDKYIEFFENGSIKKGTLEDGSPVEFDDAGIKVEEENYFNYGHEGGNNSKPSYESDDDEYDDYFIDESGM